jgi:hypothetical protein
MSLAACPWRRRGESHHERDRDASPCRPDGRAPDGRARAELKRRIATGEIDVAEVLLDCRWEADSMAIADLLISQRRWGQTRCRKFLAQLQISEKKTIGSMTDRQRQTLVAMLHGVRTTPKRGPWVTDNLMRA